jgi:hypothetical protein
MAQAKKTVKRTVKKTATKTAPRAAAAEVVAPAPECACKSRCVCWKKILIFVMGLIVGFGACCFLKCHKKKWFHRFGPKPEIFVNGCLDTAKIDCPEKLEKIQLKDADKNGCITKEEFFGGDKAERPAPRAPRRHRAPRPVAK